MKTIITTLFLSIALLSAGQTIKSKLLQLKYTLPQGWTAREFGGKSPWEEQKNDLRLCKCSGVLFTKSDSNGQMQVMVYPSTTAGLDSAKRKSVGKMEFADVEKYEKTKNKHFSFEVKRSSFTQMPSGVKKFDAIRYFAKVKDHYYIIYAWQENVGLLNSTVEKDLYEMVNAIEPN